MLSEMLEIAGVAIVEKQNERGDSDRWGKEVEGRAG